MKRGIALTLIPSTLALVIFQAHGAGFQISEHSASGLGRAFAGEAAIADNAAAGARNAASMTLFDDAQISGGFSVIQPDVSAEVTSVGGLPPVVFTGTTYDHKDVVPNAVVPNLHYLRPLSDESAVGMSVFSNFGLATDYPDNAVAGPIAGKTELTTVNFNVNYAYRLIDALSVGVGINAIYADASLSRTAGAAVFGAAKDDLAALGITSPSDKVTSLEGDGWGVGWNLGVLWEVNDDHRLGVSYRSKTDITLKGDYKGTASITSIQTNRAVSGELELNLPDILEISGFHQLAPQWAIHYSAMRIGWSTFQELRATSESCETETEGQGVCLQKDEKWDDSWRYAIGGTYYLDDIWTLRAGMAIDNSPVPDSHRTLSIPDTDRKWYTLGATYTSSNHFSIDGAFSYLSGDTVTGSETESGSTFAFKAGGNAYIYALNLNYSF